MTRVKGSSTPEHADINLLGHTHSSPHPDDSAETNSVHESGCTSSGFDQWALTLPLAELQHVLPESQLSQ